MHIYLQPSILVIIKLEENAKVIATIAIFTIFTFSAYDFFRGQNLSVKKKSEQTLYVALMYITVKIFNFFNVILSSGSYFQNCQIQFHRLFPEKTLNFKSQIFWCFPRAVQ